MDSWKKAIFIACVYGFFKELCPLVPFLTSYLTDQCGVTKADIIKQIYPVKAYTSFAAFFCVAVVADFVLYKPVIILGACASIAGWCLLGWGHRTDLLQISQFASALSLASDVAFFAYVFAVTNSTNFRRVSCVSRSAVLVGQCLSFSFGQLMTSVTSTDVQILVYVSLGSVVLSFLIAMVIPDPRSSPHFQMPVIQRELISPSGLNQSPENVNQRFSPGNLGNGSSPSTCNLVSESEGQYDQMSAPTGHQFAGLDNNTGHVQSPYMYSDIDTSSLGYAYSDGNSDISDGSLSDERPTPATRTSCFLTCGDKCSSSVVEVWRDLVEIYGNRTVFVWSLWFVAAFCVDSHVRFHGEELWRSVGGGGSGSGQREDDHAYSGAVQAIAALLGVILSLGVGFTRIDWHKCEELFIGVVMVLSAVSLVVMSHTDLWSAYVLYIACLALFQMLSTIAMFQIAGQLIGQRYGPVFGLVFGLNSFLAMFCEVIFVITISFTSLGVSIKTQFAVCGGFLGLIGLLFVTKALHSYVRDTDRFCCCRRTEIASQRLGEEQS